MNKAALVSMAAALAVAFLAVLLWLHFRDKGDQLAESGASRPAARRPENAEPPRDGPEHSTLNSTTPPGPDIDPVLLQYQENKRKSDELLRIREQYGPEALAKYRKDIETGNYADIGKVLNLSPDEVNRIFDMMVRLRSDLNAATSEVLIKELDSRNPDRAATADVTNRLNWLMAEAQEAALRSMLGNKYRVWEEHEAAQGMQGTMNNLQTLFEISDIKLLTAAQRDSLVATLAAEQVRINHDVPDIFLTSPPLQARGVQPDIKVETEKELAWELRHTPEINRRLEQAAARHLDAQQLAAFRNMLENDFNRLIASLRRFIADWDASAQDEAALEAR